MAASAGVATFSNLTLNKVSGGYTLDITSGTLTSATSSAIYVTPGAATQLIVQTTPPKNITVGAGFGLTVDALDAGGNLATGFGGGVTAAISNNPGSSTLSGSTTVTATSGVAIFSGLSLNNTGGAYSLSLASGSLASATFGPFNVTPLGQAVALEIVASPTSVEAGDGFQLTVEAVDGLGTVDSTFDGNISLALAAGPSGGTLAGASATATSGVATFSGLALNKTGSGYLLDATNSSLTSATSSVISVSPGAATQLIITGEPPATVTADASFNLTVTAEDAEGNLASSFSGSVTASLSNNPGNGSLGAPFPPRPMPAWRRFQVCPSATTAPATRSTWRRRADAGYDLGDRRRSRPARYSPDRRTKPSASMSPSPANSASSSTVARPRPTQRKPWTKSSSTGRRAALRNWFFPTRRPAMLIPPTSRFRRLHCRSPAVASSLSPTTLRTCISTSPIPDRRPQSTWANTTGSSNFLVDDSASSPPYSYIGDPGSGAYSELSGFGSETTTGRPAPPTRTSTRRRTPRPWPVPRRRRSPWAVSLRRSATSRRFT